MLISTIINAKIVTFASHLGWAVHRLTNNVLPSFLYFILHINKKITALDAKQHKYLEDSNCYV